MTLGMFAAFSLVIGVLLAYQPAAGLLLAAVASIALLVPDLERRAGIPPWWPLLAAAVLLPLNGLRPTEGVTIGDIALALMAPLVVAAIFTMKMPMRVLVPLIGLGVVTAGGLIGTIASQDWGFSNVGQGSYYDGDGRLVFKFVLGAPCVMLIVAAICQDRRRAVFLGGGYAVGATITSIFALLPGYGDPYFQRAFGLSVHQLHLGIAAIFGACFWLGVVLASQRRLVKVMAAVAFLINVNGIMLSGARSCLLGLVIAVVFLAMIGRGKGLAILFGGGIAAIGAMFAALPFMPEGSAVHRLLGTGDLVGHTTLSNNEHLLVIEDAVQEIGERPLTGFGFGQALDSHNIFLATWNSAGVLGMIGVIAVWMTFTVLWVRLLAFRVEGFNWMGAAMLAGSLGYFFVGQLENTFWDRHLWFWLTLSLIAAPWTLRDRPEAEPEMGEGAGEPAGDEPATDVALTRRGAARDEEWLDVAAADAAEEQQLTGVGSR